jgi:hypothetical protein
MTHAIVEPQPDGRTARELSGPSRLAVYPLVSASVATDCTLDSTVCGDKGDDRPSWVTINADRREHITRNPASRKM